MRTPAMVIVKVTGQYPFQMTIIQHHDMVKAVAPDATSQAFDIGILPRAPPFGLARRETICLPKQLSGLHVTLALALQDRRAHE